MIVSRAALSAGFLLAFSLASLAAAEPADKPREPAEISYYRDVRRLFQQHCQGCHQPAKPMGGYVMTSPADLLKSGDHEKPGIIPSHPERSMVIEQVLPQARGKPPLMPKGRPPLKTQEIELIRKWIAQGAKDDTPKTQQEVVDADHPPVYLLPPVISSLAYSPDGQLLAVSGHHEVLLHKGDGSGLVGRLVGLSERIQSLAFSPDGKMLAVAGGAPGRFGEIQIWEVARKKLRLSVSVTYDTLYGISWSHDGSKLAFGCSDNTVRAIETDKGKQVLFQGAHDDWALGTVFSRDSSYLVSVSRDRSMKLTEVATQRFIDNITSITPGVLKGGLLALARNPKKTNEKVKNTAAGTDQTEKWYDELIVGGDDGVPRLYKMHRTTKRVIGDDANKLREYAAMPGLIYALAFNSDGSLFVAGSSLDGSGELRVYQTADAKQVSRLSGIGPIYTVSFRPDGKQVASAGFEGIVRLSDPQTGKVLKQFTAVPITPAPIKTAQAGPAAR
jgi:WD40 repeat protein/mono/diheme cytochrome c family protein